MEPTRPNAGFAQRVVMYPAGTWLRGARRSRHALFTRAEGAPIDVKAGRLAASLLALPPAR